MATINAGGATKVRVLIESKVVIEPGWIPPYIARDEQAKAKYLKEWADKFYEFVRDHRHQDVNSVSVESVYQVQCSKCHYEFEHMTDDDGDDACAYCGAKMEIVR